MEATFGRLIAAKKNGLIRSLGALLGIAQGLLCDGHLSDREIEFLNQWMSANSAIAKIPPASIVFERVSNALADGVITEDERRYLCETLQQFLGGSIDELADPGRVSQLIFDSDIQLIYPGSLFCLTGQFAYAERAQCEEIILSKGGIVGNVTKKLNYLVVGERGDVEWKHGSLGTKIAKALDYKERGIPIKIVPERIWAPSLREH